MLCTKTPFEAEVTATRKLLIGLLQTYLSSNLSAVITDGHGMKWMLKMGLKA